MLKALVTKRFHDSKEDLVREVGAIFVADEPRLSQLESLGFIKLIPCKTSNEESNPETNTEQKATAKTTRKPKKQTPEA